MIRYPEALQDLLVSPDSIQPHPENPNNGDTDEIVRSIEVNGCYRPIIASKDSGHILAGHHLYAALLELGADRVPVTWVEATPDQERRIILADNRIAALAKMDEGLLIDLLKQVQSEDTGLLGTGYDEYDMLRLLDKQQEEMMGDGFGEAAADAWPMVTVRLPPGAHRAWLERLSEYEGDASALMCDLLEVAQ